MVQMAMLQIYGVDVCLQLNDIMDHSVPPSPSPLVDLRCQNKKAAATSFQTLDRFSLITTSINLLLMPGSVYV